MWDVALLIVDLLCVFIVTLIFGSVLWEGLLLSSHHNNVGSRVGSFSVMPNIRPHNVMP